MKNLFSSATARIAATLAITLTLGIASTASADCDKKSEYQLKASAAQKEADNFELAVGHMDAMSLPAMRSSVSIMQRRVSQKKKELDKCKDSIVCFSANSLQDELDTLQAELEEAKSELSTAEAGRAEGVRRIKQYKSEATKWQSKADEEACE